MFKNNRWMVLCGVLLLILGATSAYNEFSRSANLPTGGNNGSDDGFAPYLIPISMEGTATQESSPEPTATPFQPGYIKGTPNRPTQIATPTPQPTPSATTLPIYIPDRLVIPKISLDAPIVPANSKMITIDEVDYQQWQAPDKLAAGWHSDSATLGGVGNMVLNGHHNIYGEVFGKLVDLEVGDIIQVFSAEKNVIYQINNKMILPERFETIESRQENAVWLQPTDDMRLTLVTCWPHSNNTHRLIIVASPITSLK